MSIAQEIDAWQGGSLAACMPGHRARPLGFPALPRAGSMCRRPQQGDNILGMHYGFVAVPAAVEALEREFAAVWPHYQLTHSAALASLDDWFDWKRRNERFVAARDWTPENLDVEVFGFLQDGDWAVLLDTSHTLTTNAEALARLSLTFGRCLSFVIETAGGCASFAAYRQGQLQRSIDNVDGKVDTQGQPLPEEEGLDIGGYYMDETEALQQRLGFRAFSGEAPIGILAIATVDRTDYSEQLPRIAPLLEKKPWWKLW